MGNIQRTGTTGGIKQPALSLDRQVEDPDRSFSFLSYLQFRTDSTLIGFHTVYVAFLLLLLPELAVYVMRGGLPGLELFGLVALFLAGAFLATVFFQSAVFAARLLDAVLSHIDDIWRPAVPGLIVFLVLGQPVFQVAGYYLEVETWWVELLFGLGLLVLSAGLSAAALWVFPVLRGINSTLLLVAACGGRAVMFPFEFRQAYAGAADFAVYIVSIIVCAFFLSIALQQRYRLQLSPYYERFIIDRRLMLGGLAFTLAGLVAYIWLENLKADPFRYVGGDLVVRPAISGRTFVPGSLILYCMTYWLIASMMLNLINTDRFPEFLTRSRLYRGFGAACAAGLVAVLYLALLFDSRTSRARIVQFGDVSAELLSLPGVLLDKDGDSNSAWPGGDPDDRDPCLRDDFHDRCLFSRLKEQQKEPDRVDATPAAGLRRANFEAPVERRSALGTGSVNRTIILTFAGEPANAPIDLDDFFDGYSAALEAENRAARARAPGRRKTRKGKIRTAPARPRTTIHRSRFLLAVNNIPEAMPALARSLDGVELRTGIERRSIFSELAEAGFRTVCGGRVAGAHDASYLDGEHEMDLDSGCQVYITPEDLGAHDERLARESEPGLLPVSRAMYRAMRKYTEKRTVTWIHFDGRALPLRDDTSVARAEFTETIDLLRKYANVLVVPLGSGEKLTVPVWLIARQRVRVPPEFSTFRHLVLTATGASGVTPPPPGFEDEYTGILTTPWISATWASALFYRLNIRYPLITYKRKAGQVHVFDGITGARWELDETSN